jgi:D-sedoheptulose 7-phosphate isomerase
MSAAASIREELAAHVDLVRKVSDGMAADIAALAELFLATVSGGGKILFCGNGGSAADAQHLAAEYVVRFSRARKAVAALALTTDTSVLTAVGNDLGFDRVFERQVEALGRPGDLLMIQSTSGASKNLLLAVEAARVIGVRTAALLARDGGALRDRVDLALVVPTSSTARAQEVHMIIGHLVCELVDRELPGGSDG